MDMVRPWLLPAVSHSTFVEYTIAYKYYNGQDRVLEMLHISVKQKTILTFSIMVFALASLFAAGPIFGNQEAFAANAGGSFGGGGGGSLIGGGIGGGSGGHADFVGTSSGFESHGGGISHIGGGSFAHIGGGSFAHIGGGINHIGGGINHIGGGIIGHVGHTGFIGRVGHFGHFGHIGHFGHFRHFGYGEYG
jgi:hypothetical protein